MIDRNKVISQLRQQEVEHSFETMVGCRKNRYCNTPEQKKRTEFFEDYYLLYTRKEKEIKILKKALELACERIKYFEQQQDLEMGVIEFFGQEIDYDVNAIVENYINDAKEMLKNE
jgi:hypothetical protein